VAALERRVDNGRVSRDFVAAVEQARNQKFNLGSGE
jgi:hypothetical protein